MRKYKEGIYRVTYRDTTWSRWRQDAYKEWKTEKAMIDWVARQPENIKIVKQEVGWVVWDDIDS